MREHSTSIAGVLGQEKTERALVYLKNLISSEAEAVPSEPEFDLERALSVVWQFLNDIRNRNVDRILPMSPLAPIEEVRLACVAAEFLSYISIEASRGNIHLRTLSVIKEKLGMDPLSMIELKEDLQDMVPVRVRDETRQRYGLPKLVRTLS